MSPSLNIKIFVIKPSKKSTKGSEDIVKDLLEKVEDVNIKSEDGDSILSMALQKGMIHNIALNGHSYLIFMRFF